MATNIILSSESQISQAERWLISDQLTRVLLSPWFRSSSRCSQLLRHSVELTIHGQVDRLKERQIAMEAFHRKSTYDNNTDPIVRVAAGEVRKRLAQYYGVPENAGQIRIELPVGSYVAVFHFPDLQEELPKVESTSAQPEEYKRRQEDTSDNMRGVQGRQLLRTPQARSIGLILAAVVLLSLAAASAWREFRPAFQPSGFNTFWSPVFSSLKTPLISLGGLRARELTFVPDPHRSHQTEGFRIAMAQGDLQDIRVERLDYSYAAARVSSVFGAKNSAFDMLDQSETTFADFSGRPTVLVGSYDNDWSMGITEGKRFEFKYDTARRLKWIADRDKPGKEIGAMQITSLEPTTYEAFSIVMRQTGQLSQQPRILLAGVGDKGTVAAAEFVSNPKYLNDFAQHAPKGWRKKNIEFLIQTRVIEGVVGIPIIVDYSVW